MSEREVREAAVACPFVAFDDDRDHRLDRPDHRHRCFAEVRPATRAAAHQEAYCLSARFATCPTFVDWAARESARVRQGGASEPTSTSVVPPPTEPDVEPEWTPGRTAARDWAAPPPWLSDAPATSARAGTASSDDARRAPQEERAADPAAGSAEDRSEPPSLLGDAGRPSSASSQPRTRTSTERDAAAAAAYAAGRSALSSDLGDDVESEADREEDEPRRYGPAAGRSRRREPADPGAPSWERGRRNEAYPTLRTRTGISVPGGSPLVLAAAGIIALAIALFFIPPMLLGLGGGEASATPTPSPSADASASPSPTPVPSPTSVTYVVKTGDTMSTIAAQFGVTLDELIAANRETVPNPDLLQVGQTLIIPGGAAPEVPGASPSG